MGPLDGFFIARAPEETERPPLCKRIVNSAKLGSERRGGGRECGDRGGLDAAAAVDGWGGEHRVGGEDGGGKEGGGEAGGGGRGEVKGQTEGEGGGWEQEGEASAASDGAEGGGRGGGEAAAAAATSATSHRQSPGAWDGREVRTDDLLATLEAPLVGSRHSHSQDSHTASAAASAAAKGKASASLAARRESGAGVSRCGIVGGMSAKPHQPVKKARNSKQVKGGKGPKKASAAPSGRGSLDSFVVFALSP